MAQQLGLSESDCPERIDSFRASSLDAQKDQPIELAFELQKNCESKICKRARRVLVLLFTPALVLVIISHPAFSQTRSMLDPGTLGSVQALKVEELSPSAANAPEAPVVSDDSGSPNQPERRGLMRRGITRTLRDQKELTAPHFSALTLSGTRSCWREPERC
jgi:hypothetical protein